MSSQPRRRPPRPETRCIHGCILRCGYGVGTGTGTGTEEELSDASVNLNLITLLPGYYKFAFSRDKSKLCVPVDATTRLADI